ncbi:MAG: hypothetical protein LUC17_01825 [Oscillospiraceae bacterium]|nr:hypothetical protein [Oscillospiraceae bacterium]
MKKIFIGLLIVLFDIRITVAETHVIGLLPDFIGYIVIIFGVNQLLKLWKSQALRVARVLCYPMILFSAYSYLRDILGLEVDGFAILWALLCAVICSVITFMLTRSVRDVENQAGLELGSGRLTIRWLFSAIVEVVICFLLPYDLIYLICLFVQLVVNVIFLSAFYQSDQKYEWKGNSSDGS